MRQALSNLSESIENGAIVEGFATDADLADCGVCGWLWWVMGLRLWRLRELVVAGLESLVLSLKWLKSRYIIQGFARWDEDAARC